MKTLKCIAVFALLVSFVVMLETIIYWLFPTGDESVMKTARWVIGVVIVYLAIRKGIIRI